MNLRSSAICFLSASAVLVWAASDQPWKDKPVADWSEDDARQVLTDSPWAHSATGVFKSANQRNGRGGMGRNGGGMGRGGGVGIGGIGIGLPGGPGMGRNRGPWGGNDPGVGGPGQYPSQYPNDGGGSGPGDTRSDSRTPPHLTVRWESARPVQDAELKAKVTDAPSLAESDYGIVVLGVPSRMLSISSGAKPTAELKRDGKKTIKATNVRVLQRDDGPIVVFEFPRSKEISPSDHSVTFDATIGQVEAHVYFDLGEMLYRGKLEL